MWDNYKRSKLETIMSLVGGKKKHLKKRLGRGYWRGPTTGHPVCKGRWETSKAGRQTCPQGASPLAYVKTREDSECHCRDCDPWDFGERTCISQWWENSCRDAWFYIIQWLNRREALWILLYIYNQRTSNADLIKVKVNRNKKILSGARVTGSQWGGGKEFYHGVCHSVRWRNEH